MSTCKCKWMVGACLLVALSAMAQESSPGTASSTAPELAGRPSTASQTSAAAAPTDMDQVVDRVIERQHALMDMLKTRTPYLQNLKLDRNMGPSPAQDHLLLWPHGFG